MNVRSRVCVEEWLCLNVQVQVYVRVCVRMCVYAYARACVRAPDITPAFLELTVAQGRLSETLCARNGARLHTVFRVDARVSKFALRT